MLYSEMLKSIVFVVKDIDLVKSWRNRGVYTENTEKRNEIPIGETLISLIAV